MGTDCLSKIGRRIKNNYYGLVKIISGEQLFCTAAMETQILQLCCVLCPPAGDSKVILCLLVD